MFCVFYAFSYLFAPLVKESRASSLTLPAFFLLFIIVYMCVFFFLQYAFFFLTFCSLAVSFFFFTPCFAFQFRTAFFFTGRKKNTIFLSEEKVDVLQKKEKRKKKRGVFVVASKRCATLRAFMHLSGSTTQTFTVISVVFFFVFSACFRCILCFVFFFLIPCRPSVCVNSAFS